MATYRTYTVQEKIKMYTHYKKHGKAATVRKYNVSYATLTWWLRRAEKGGAPLSVLLARKPKRHTVCNEVVDLVKKLHAKHPELSLEELRQKVKHVQHISRTTVWKVVSGNYKEYLGD